MTGSHIELGRLEKFIYTLIYPITYDALVKIKLNYFYPFYFCWCFKCE